MRNLSSLLLVVMFSVATVAIAWAPAFAVGMTHDAAAEARPAAHAEAVPAPQLADGHGAHAAADNVAQWASGHAGHAASAPAEHASDGAPGPSPVAAAHPCGAAPDDCAAMAFGCASLTVHAAAAGAEPFAAERSQRTRRTFRDIVGAGLAPGLLDRPPRA